jgi:hypothetical protein
MSPVRARYLAGARTALDLLASQEVRDRWDEASALAGLAVGDLAGHLALSGVLLVETVLDQPDPRSSAPITAGQYYGAFVSADEYLRGRCVELAVHVEDLELSVGLGPGVTATDRVPEPPDDLVRGAIDVLVAAAVVRHGAPAVLRALARRERDQVQALRVL